MKIQVFKLLGVQLLNKLLALKHKDQDRSIILNPLEKLRFSHT